MSITNVPELFGSMVFNDTVMKERLPKDVYKKLKKTMREGTAIDADVAAVVATAMKDWAISKGATHYTHWFQPMTGITADKHEVRRNPEYYVMRHFSHYVRPGAKVLGTTGHFNSMAIAFRNPDGTVVVVAQNALDEERPFEFADPDAAERGFKVTLAPRSFNTFVLD